MTFSIAMANTKLYPLNQNQTFGECAIFPDLAGAPSNSPYMEELTFSWEYTHLKKITTGSYERNECWFSLFRVRQEKLYWGVDLRDEYEFARGAVGEGHPKQREEFKNMNL